MDKCYVESCRMHHRSHDQHPGRSWLPSMHHRSHDWGVCIWGERVCLQGGLGGNPPPPPPELGKRAVRIVLECFVVEYELVVQRDSLQKRFLCCLLSGETWSEEASDLFEELSHAAKWKILMARTVTYRQTEDASVPCIELIDTNGKTVQKSNL